MIMPLAPAHFVALGAFHVFALLLWLAPGWAWAPLAGFVLSCAVAPFLPTVGFFLPITSRGPRSAKGVALTFDDGPDPLVTPRVLELLARHGARATFFVTGRRAEAHPDLVAAILAGGHTLGNHSYSHHPFLMCLPDSSLRREVGAAQEVLQRAGVTTLAFRPPVGISNSRLWRVLLEQGMFCVNFSLRAADLGNRRIRDLAGKLLKRVRPGDIVLLHDVAPPGGSCEALLAEFEALLKGLAGRGLAVLPLEQLLGREIMQRGAGGSGAIELFYDGLAPSYDQEQFGSAVSRSRRTEMALFQARLPGLLEGAGRILEVGAGTGIFTPMLARHGREVVALDISQRMLDRLQARCAREGLANVRPLAGDAETIALEGPFSAVCAFSSLAYLKDLPAFLGRLGPQVEPGGTLYFLTARSSLFRFFTQIGNAMRQGLWLRAYRCREMERMLDAAGFEPVSVTSHLLKSWISGGMLMEVVARRRPAS